MEEKLPFFGPLNFEQGDKSLFKYVSPESEETKCVFCDYTVFLPCHEKDLLTHFYMEHRLVIADVNKIADFMAYISTWRSKLTETNLEYYCTTMLMDQKPDGTKSKDEKYYLLSDVLPLDNEIRTNIQKQKLEKLLAQHKYEREDASYERECLFCRHVSKDTRGNYLKHLCDKHNLYVAKSENLVFVGELINLIGKKLESLVCIYCEKVFKDRVILKEHMRKKGHKRINATNKEYDKFFLVNYLEPGQTWQPPQVKQPKKQRSRSVGSQRSTKSKEDDTKNDYELYKCGYEESDSDPDWSAWEEKNEQKVTCLFCKQSKDTFDDTLNHMTVEHNFNFRAVTKNMDFYQKVKTVNYIRKQIHINECVNCELECGNNETLLNHMRQANHFIVDNQDLWNQPEYFFPTYEDDPFLCFLDDDDEGFDELKPKETITTETEISEQVALAVLRDQ